MPLAVPADMILRYDSRTLGDIVSDTGTQVTEAGLATDTKMLEALSSAEGFVLAILLRSELYTRVQLSALTGTSLSLLKTLICAVALWELWKRKIYGGWSDENRKMAKLAAEETLEHLRRGDYVFESNPQISAGVADVDQVSVIGAEEMRLFVDQARHGNFYPRRRVFGV